MRHRCCMSVGNSEADVIDKMHEQNMKRYCNWYNMAEHFPAVKHDTIKEVDSQSELLPDPFINPRTRLSFPNERAQIDRAQVVIISTE